MNSKIKILLGVFFVFALLTPIYAGTNMGLALHKPSTVDSAQAPSADSRDSRDSEAICSNRNLIDHIDLSSITYVNQNNYSFTVHFIEGNTTPITHLRAFFADGTGEYEQFDMKEDEINNLPPNKTPSITMENLDLSNLQDGTITVTVSYNNLRCGFNDRCGVRTTTTKDTVVPQDLIEVYEKDQIEKRDSFEIKGTIKNSAKLKVNVLYKDVDITNRLIEKLKDRKEICEINPNIVSSDDVKKKQFLPSHININLPVGTTPISREIVPRTKDDFTCEFNIDGFEKDSKDYTIIFTAIEEEKEPQYVKISLTVDRTAPEVSVGLDTRERSPILTGTVKDDLLSVNKDTFKITVNGVDYAPEVNDDGTWEVQLNRLPRGTHTVYYFAEDRLGNKTKDDAAKKDAIIIRSATGTGTRVRGTTTTPTVNPTPTPVTPAPQPVVTTPTVVNTPTPQPVVTTPTTPTPATSTETAPTTGNVAVANPEKTSGTTGFLGLSENASTGVALLIGALLVIGALGYFLFFARDKKEKE